MRKNKNLIILLAFSALIVIPFLTYAQIYNVEDHKKAVDWMQGGAIHEDWFMKEFMTGYKSRIWSHYDWFTGMAQSLAAIFTIIHFSIKSYEMMIGDTKHFQILPLLRPFGLAMIILWWKIFCQIISYPTDIIAAKASTEQELQQQKVNNLRFTRAEYQYALVSNLYDMEAKTSVAAEESVGFFKDPLGSMTRGLKKAATTVIAPVMELKSRMEIGMQLVMTQILEALALWILRVCVYFVFALQVIYSSILVILGPLAVAASILPAFKDSFTTWIARFISVNLYVGIAYMVMFISGLFQEFAMQAEIKRYMEVVHTDGILADANKLLYLKENGVLSFGMVIVSFLLSALTMFTVPSISTWIISSSGITSAATTFSRKASDAADSLKKGAKSLASGGMGA